MRKLLHRPFTAGELRCACPEMFQDDNVVLRSGICTMTIAASTTTIPRVCTVRIVSPRKMAVRAIENTGSRQLATMARVGSRYFKPAKNRENGTSDETSANTTRNPHWPVE